MVTRERIYTVDDLRAIENLPENADKRFELINGEITELNAPSPLHAYTADEIYSALRTYAKHHNLGYTFSDSVSYTLHSGSELIPDASFIYKERISLPFPSKFEFAPDLAVEVFSPSNREREMLEKVEAYLESGTKLVWVAYPTSQVVDVYHRNADGSLTLRKIDIEGTLDGEDVLPGFKLSVKTIFPAAS